MHFQTATLTRPGDQKTNQDFCDSIIAHDTGCWIMADGLGGHRGGETASRLAVETMLRAFADQPHISPATIQTMLEAAQQSLQEKQEEIPKLYGMRTTAVILIANAETALWAHVGDSRLYHFRSGRIAFQTKDHSVPQAMAAAGDIREEDIRFHEDRNRLLRTLGKEGDLRPTILETPTQTDPGDAFLLCTDGFWEYVFESEMEADLVASEGSEQWLEKMEDRLMARVGKGHDNYSALGIRIASTKAS